MKYNPGMRKRPRQVKAYNNNTFLNSREARNIRVQCEMTEPAIHLKRSGIRHMVTFFGSARLGSESAFENSDYKAAYDMARSLGEWTIRRPGSDGADMDIAISSGGGPGIMEAVNRGAHDVGAKSIGMGISLPFEQKNNQYVSPDLDFEFHYFFTRKYWCVYLSKAFVIMPGGVGTMDELFEIVTLMQTGKMKERPIVLFNSEFWNETINFERMLKHGTISQQDVDRLHITDDVADATNYIKRNITLD